MSLPEELFDDPELIAALRSIPTFSTEEELQELIRARKEALRLEFPLEETLQEEKLSTADPEVLVWTVPWDSREHVLAGRVLVDQSGMILRFPMPLNGFKPILQFSDEPISMYQLDEERIETEATILYRATFDLERYRGIHVAFSGPEPELTRFATRTDAMIATLAVEDAIPSMPTELARLIATYAAFWSRGVRLKFAFDLTRWPNSSLYGRVFSDPPPKQIAPSPPPS